MNIDKKLLGNFSSLLVSNFSVQGLRFLTVILFSRKLGPEFFGIYNYIILLVSLAAILVEFGLKNYAIREFSKGLGSWGLIGRIMKVRLGVSFLSYFVVLGFAYQAFRSTELVEIAALFAASLMIDAFLIDFVAITEERLYLQALGQFLQAAVFLILAYLSLRNGINMKNVALGFVVSHVFLVATFFFGTRKIPITAKRSPSKMVIAGGLPYLAATIASTLQSQMDVFLLGQFHFSQVLGDYTACLKLLAVPMGVVNSLVSSLQPRLAKHSEHKMVGYMWRFARPLVILALVMNAVIFIFDRDLMLLVFGNKYQNAYQYFFPLSLVTTMFIATLLPMHALFVSHRTKKLLQLAWTNLGLSFLCIAVSLYFGGPIFLPWAMLFVQTFCCIQAWLTWRKLAK